MVLVLFKLLITSNDALTLCKSKIRFAYLQYGCVEQTQTFFHCLQHTSRHAYTDKGGQKYITIVLTLINVFKINNEKK